MPNLENLLNDVYGASCEIKSRNRDANAFLKIYVEYGFFMRIDTRGTCVQSVRKNNSESFTIMGHPVFLVIDDSGKHGPWQIFSDQGECLCKS